MKCKFLRPETVSVCKYLIKRWNKGDWSDGEVLHLSCDSIFLAPFSSLSSLFVSQLVNKIGKCFIWLVLCMIWLLYASILLHTETDCYFLNSVALLFLVCPFEKKQHVFFLKWNLKNYNRCLVQNTCTVGNETKLSSSLLHTEFAIAFPDSKQKQSVNRVEIDCLQDVFCMKGRKSAFHGDQPIVLGILQVKLSLAFWGEISSKYM